MRFGREVSDVLVVAGLSYEGAADADGEREDYDATAGHCLVIPAARGLVQRMGASPSDAM